MGRVRDAVFSLEKDRATAEALHVSVDSRAAPAFQNLWNLQWMHPYTGQAEERLHHSLPSSRGEAEGQTLISVVTSDRTQGTGLKLWRGVWVGYQEKILSPEGGWALDQAPQASGYGTKPGGAQKAFG